MNRDINRSWGLLQVVGEVYGYQIFEDNWA